MIDHCRKFSESILQPYSRRKALGSIVVMCVAHHEMFRRYFTAGLSAFIILRVALLFSHAALELFREHLMDTLTSLLPMSILLGIVVFASVRQEKRKIELEKVKAKAEWDRASESFRDDVTQEELGEIVAGARRSVKRLESLTVVGHRVYGTVAALSGISSWKFVIDFDYSGHLTSDYTVASSNEDSGIPERVAALIAKGIRTWTPGGHKVRATFCPYCGTKASGDASYCSSCGAKLPQVPKRP